VRRDDTHNLLHRRHLGYGLDSVRHLGSGLDSVLRLLWHSLGLLLIILWHSLSLDCLWGGLLILWCSLSLGGRDGHAGIDCHGGSGGGGGIRRSGCRLEKRRTLFVGTRHREPGSRTTRSFFCDLHAPGMGGQTHDPHGDGGAQALRVLTLATERIRVALFDSRRRP
jgi:hypothetical protein